MIAKPYITEWSSQAPWADDVQVEQDMLLSRLLIDIANDDLLGRALAFRGGTCLQKLHLPAPLRYSEDLDYVRTDDEPLLGEIFEALRRIAGAIGLREHRRKFPSSDSDLGTIWFDGEPEAEQGRIRIKIEANVAETTPAGEYVQLPFEMRTRWWSGQARVRTFSLEELTATKLRALYQRRKGRDLFDLWATITHLELDDQLAIVALTHYERLNDRRAFTFPQLRQNLAQKLQDQEFLGDVGALVAIPEDAYDPKEAAHLVMTRLGVRLRNAPTGSEGFEGL